MNRPERIDSYSTRTDRKTPPNFDDPRLYALLTLLSLEKRIRWAEPEEKRFIAVNELKSLIPFTSAALWETESPKLKAGRITALSNTSTVRRATPFYRLLTDVFQRVQCNYSDESGVAITKSDLIRPSIASDQRFTSEWDEWLPQHGYYQPLRMPSGQIVGSLLLTRDQPFTERETTLIAQFSDALSNAIVSKRKTRPSVKSYLTGKNAFACTVALLAALFFPVPSSVLSPAEVHAADPEIIRSPLAGVVAEVAAVPNASVEAGQVIMRLDQTELRSQLAVAASTLEAAQTEALQISQTALIDVSSQSRLASANAAVRKASIEIDRLTAQMDKTFVRAQRNGRLLLDTSIEWVGRPIIVGERLFSVADPQNTELVLELAERDRIALAPDSRVLFFSNSLPVEPRTATVSQVSHSAHATIDGRIAFRIHAIWADKTDAALPLGERGTAKVFGPKKPLMLQILRKPLASLRQLVGV